MALQLSLIKTNKRFKISELRMLLTSIQGRVAATLPLRFLKDKLIYFTQDMLSNQISIIYCFEVTLRKHYSKLIVKIIFNSSMVEHSSIHI